MVQNPPPGYQRAIPYLLYADAPAAIDHLVQAFGFQERFRMEMQPGQIGHAELALDEGNVVMVATALEAMGCASPKDLPALHSLTTCYVDDVDAHFAHAKAAGATILSEPKTMPYGDRTYRAKDVEGHLWTFATHVEDVDLSQFESSSNG
jgi:uncharacterized glyoxalase superfamily protein PhnB